MYCNEIFQMDAQTFVCFLVLKHPIYGIFDIWYIQYIVFLIIEINRQFFLSPCRYVQISVVPLLKIILLTLSQFEHGIVYCYITFHIRMLKLLRMSAFQRNRHESREINLIILCFIRDALVRHRTMLGENIFLATTDVCRVRKSFGFSRSVSSSSFEWMSRLVEQTIVKQSRHEWLLTSFPASFPRPSRRPLTHVNSSDTA